MKDRKLTAEHIAQWIDNDEGLYRWKLSSKLPMKVFIRRNRAELESLIYRAMGGDDRAKIDTWKSEPCPYLGAERYR